MKKTKHFFGIAVLVIFALLFGCELLSLTQTHEWTIDGIALLNGLPTFDIKLGVFYTGSGVFNIASVLVSNVANLGVSGGAIVLDIDVSNLNPHQGECLELIMWEDENGNNIYEFSETYDLVAPQPGCPVFQASWFCQYYYAEDFNEYMGTAPGWNQSLGLAYYVPIDEATKTGAKIINSFSWL